MDQEILEEFHKNCGKCVSHVDQENRIHKSVISRMKSVMVAIKETILQEHLKTKGSFSKAKAMRRQII